MNSHSAALVSSFVAIVYARNGLSKWFGGNRSSHLNQTPFLKYIDEWNEWLMPRPVEPSLWYRVSRYFFAKSYLDGFHHCIYLPRMMSMDCIMNTMLNDDRLIVKSLSALSDYEKFVYLLIRQSLKYMAPLFVQFTFCLGFITFLSVGIGLWCLLYKWRWEDVTHSIYDRHRRMGILLILLVGFFIYAYTDSGTVSNSEYATEKGLLGYLDFQPQSHFVMVDLGKKWTPFPFSLFMEKFEIKQLEYQDDPACYSVLGLYRRHCLKAVLFDAQDRHLVHFPAKPDFFQRLFLRLRYSLIDGTSTVMIITLHASTLAVATIVILILTYPVGIVMRRCKKPGIQVIMMEGTVKNNNEADEMEQCKYSTPGRNHRGDSVTSHRYYDPESVDQKLKSFIETTSTGAQPKQPKTKQSRHLPFWVWFVIAKCNGIPLKSGEKPILGTVIHCITFANAITFALSNSWYVVYDIISPNTPQDIPSGTVGILLVFCWCAFGYYCKDLSSRLFCHPRFLKDVRMHSRTVFKINAAFLVFLLGALFTFANVYESLQLFHQHSCEEINLEEIVCSVLSVSSIMFSIFTLIWHSLISFVFISVCRTHTIGLRRYIREIEYDAAVCEHHNSFLYKKLPISQEDIWQESIWMAEDYEDYEDYFYDKQLNIQKHRMSVTNKNVNKAAEQSSKDIGEKESGINDYGNRAEEIGILLSPVLDNVDDPEQLARSDEFEWNYLRGEQTLMRTQSMKTNGAAVECPESTSVISQTMSNSEIMHHYWKLNCRLRFSSCALQRWFASFIALVLLRCSTYLVHWLGHVATVYDILQFVVPLVLLIVLSSALAEVNVEGLRALRTMYPTQERVQMLQFLSSNPLLMSIYGFGMTHGTIVTVIFAILVGFVTRIIITEMTK